MNQIHILDYFFYEYVKKENHIYQRLENIIAIQYNKNKIKILKFFQIKKQHKKWLLGMI